MLVPITYSNSPQKFGSNGGLACDMHAIPTVVDLCMALHGLACNMHGLACDMHGGSMVIGLACSCATVHGDFDSIFGRLIEFGVQ